MRGSARPHTPAAHLSSCRGCGPANRCAKGSEERRFVINDAGAATVRGAAAGDVTWQFTAIPDKPPTIALVKEPEGQARGALQLSYKLEDDYGVVGALDVAELEVTSLQAAGEVEEHPLVRKRDV
jgi:hypothetical protein